MKKLILLLALLLAGGLAAPAVAKKVQHSGQIVGDRESRITMRVTFEEGEVGRVGGFRASGIDVACPDGPRQFAFRITGSIRVSRNGSFRTKIPNRRAPDDKLRLTGKVVDGGKRVVGNVKAPEFSVGGSRCEVPKQRFVTKKKRR